MGDLLEFAIVMMLMVELVELVNGKAEKKKH